MAAVEVQGAVSRVPEDEEGLDGSLAQEGGEMVE